MSARMIDQMEPWAQWMVRHHMVLVLVIMQWVVLLPIAICIEVIKVIPELWSDCKVVHANTMRAAREVRKES